MIITAYKRTLGPDDIWEQSPKLKSRIVAPRLEAAWKKEHERSQNRFVCEYSLVPVVSNY